MTSDATYHAHWQQSQELHDRGASSPTPVVTERIEGHWLVEQTNGHTCGTGPGGHYGAHEPGCGQVPIVDLRGLDGWDQLAAEIESDLSERYSILAAQHDHLLAALSVEKSKTIPEIRDMYGLTEGERP